MAAYLTQDGRWATYLERLPLETEVFRLGQSFWPEDHLAPAPPVDLVGRWSIHPVPLPEHRHRQSGLPLEQAFYFASFRTAPDETGDFALVAGLNSFGRNYFHVFNLVELRLDGVTLLQGYRNQVHTYADGMMSPQLSRDGAFEYGDCVGQTALVTGFVPRSGFAAWRRNVVQRIGRYVLVIDELQYAGDSENFEARFLWESPFDFMPVSGGRFNLVLTDPANPKKIPGLADYARVPAAPGLRERRYALLFSEPDAGQTVHDTSAAFEYRCAVRQNDNRTFFSLLTRDTEQPLGCRRISDSAAVLDLPEPAVVVRGEFESVRADLAVLAADHLFGHNLACAGPLLWADHPVDLDWDFSTGRLAVVASVPTQLRLRAASGPRTIDVPCGRHTLTDLEPDPLAVKDPIERAHTLQSEPSASVSHLASNAKTSLSPAFEYQAPEPLRLLTVASSEDRPILYAAGEKTVYVLSCEGKLHHTLSTDARIQALHWWPEKNLLLVGCFDDKVLAFDPQGQRRWTFVSEMDPAVFRAAKTYWFKTQPGHEGIHGLFSGKFLDGKSQAFVGSACTLEILDDAGRLVRRLPVFWGPGHQFTLVDAPDGSLNLLVARKPGCAHALAVVNNRRLDADPPHRFNDVPAGHTAVGTGFASTNTLRILVEDLKGHGRNSVVTLINGSWNRVGVFDLEGNPLANAHFGPGEPTTLAPDPGLANKNLRGLEVADVNADGQKEILVATAAGLIVALDPRCQTLWSHRLPEPPAVLQVVRSRIFVGCEGGGVRVLDGQGRPVAFASISGTPIGLAGIDSGSGPLAVFATAAGRLVGFHPDFS